MIDGVLIKELTTKDIDFLTNKKDGPSIIGTINILKRLSDGNILYLKSSYSRRDYEFEFSCGKIG